MPQRNLNKILRDTGGRKARSKVVERLTGAMQFLNNEQATQHQERVADALRGWVQPASGAFPNYKSDVVNKHFQIECKSTRRRSLSIKTDWIIKISNEAESNGRMPAVAITFDQLPLVVEKDWILLPLSLLNFLVSKAEENQKQNS